MTTSSKVQNVLDKLYHRVEVMAVVHEKQEFTVEMASAIEKLTQAIERLERMNADLPFPTGKRDAA